MTRAAEINHARRAALMDPFMGMPDVTLLSRRVGILFAAKQKTAFRTRGKCFAGYWVRRSSD